MGYKGEEPEDMVELDKEMVFVVKLHETIVSNFDVTPLSINLRKDPDFGLLEGEFVLEYDLGFGEKLIIVCKREGGNMLIILESGEKQMNYSVPLDLYIDDDFMPVIDEEFMKLVQDWFE
jgi:hypothetical protein